MHTVTLQNTPHCIADISDEYDRPSPCFQGTFHLQAVTVQAQVRRVPPEALPGRFGHKREA